METIRSILETIKHHKILVIYLVAISVIIFGFFGCESKVKSLLDDPNLVTRTEIMAEIEFFLAKAKGRLIELDQKDAFRKIVFDFTTISLESGQVNPSGLFIALLGLLGAGTIGNYAGKNTAAKKLDSKNTIEE